MRTLKLISVFLATTFFALGQARKEFEVASIRPAQEQQAQVAIGLRLDGSQVHISYLSLKDYIAMAHRLGVNQVIGPDWLDSVRFDISGKLPDGAKRSDVNEMLQSLLVERFGMKTHLEKKEFPVYTLQIADSGLRVNESMPAEAFADADAPLNVAAAGNGSGVSIDYGNGSTFAIGATTLETKRLTMGMFAGLLTRFMDRPVVDQTNLKAGYNFNFELTPEDRNVMLIRSAVAAGVVLPAQAMALLNTPSGDSLGASMRKIGLQMDSRRAPLDVVVVDQMQKTPTAN